ncbi:MAG: acetyl-CoA carboxylase biotin carboxylase subunit [Gemmatimonadaceae bacterium]|nr:acetyl-CoA carboxylase biotin carboxylase subunit [Gemmatimonadaceae bacterium]
MFKRVLIANRGEIAVRVIRACQELGVETVAVYSTADRDALHVRLADHSVCIGPGPAPDSYLNIPNVISAAVNSGADAIHPGAGFLAENAYFAEICGRYDLAYIGPSPEILAIAGDKGAAVQAARDADVPALPTSTKRLVDLQTAKTELRALGLPAMLKATAGGGGRGMRRILNNGDLTREFPRAQAEAKSSFSNPDLYLERLLLGVRHIEVQILGDDKNVVSLGERDCSVQRRHQKVIEEGPAPRLDDRTRKRIADAAVKFARKLKYHNAGTVEFLLDAAGDFYFLELNARIQIEHPVTEMVTGIDIVKEQISLAAGERLSINQKSIKSTGHAIECRIVAEDPENDWAPASGLMTEFQVPGGPGVRVDTHMSGDQVVSPHYDSLLAKVICRGEDRAHALEISRRALTEFRVSGLPTNREYLLRVLDSEEFVEGEATLESALGEAPLSGLTPSYQG